VRDDLNRVLPRGEHRLFLPTHCLRLIDAILAKLQRPLGNAAFAPIAFFGRRGRVNGAAVLAHGRAVEGTGLVDL
jgi:hypothetical protein